MAGAFDRAVGILSRLLPTGIVGRWSKEGAPPTAAVDHGRPLRGTPVGDLGAFVDSVPVLLATVDATGRCRFANRACEEWFGSPRGGLVGKHLREVLGERCWAVIEEHVQAVLAGRQVTFDTSIPRHAGGPRTVRTVWFPRRGDGGRVDGFLARIEDITERRQEEDALRLIMEGTAQATGGDFFRSLVQHLARALGVRVAFVAELVEPAATTARTLALWLGDSHAADVEYVLAGTPCEHVVAQGLSVFPDAVRARFPDDRWLAEVGAESYLGVPFLDRAGRAIGHMGVLDDRPMADLERKTAILRIFAARAGGELERQRAEAALREREAQLRQAQKMEAIGTFAIGIAHDLNGMLAPILGFAEFAMADLPEGSPAHQKLEAVLVATGRAASFVDQILLFGSGGEPERELVRLRSVVEDVLGLIGRSLPPNVRIRTRIETAADTVLADATQMRQMVMNLCTNAGHAMRAEGGTLDVLLDRVDGTPLRLAAGSPRAGPHVRLAIRDSGHGIPADVIPRVFEPFFTTKPRHEGSGLGLAVVHGIVTGHGGAVAVESSPGEGTTFEVFLPYVEGTVAAAADDAGPVPRGGGRVLLVDDDAAHVRMRAQVLGALGYEAVPHGTGAEALEAFRAAPGSFAAVVTDQMMPGMTGAELAAEALRIRPDTPIILCTGYSETLTPERAREIGIREYLRKPVAMRSLAEALCRATGRAPGRAA